MNQQQINRSARATAIEAMARLSLETTSLVNYQSKGRAVIIGDNQALEVAPRLNQQLSTFLLLTEGVEEPGVPLVPLGGRSIRIEGYLGDFKIQLGEPGRSNAETLAADLILDLSPEPLIDSQVKPPGYRHAGFDEADLQGAMDELSELTGSFEKPRFFDYDPDICAHGHAGKRACTRCIDACPADAISSLVETIEVNAYLCQGGGVCASVCPSGAIRYVYPSARDNLHRLRRLLSVYREQGGGDPLIVLMAESDEPPTEPAADNQLPFAVEELASVGLEFWLSALAYGASAVLLADNGAMPASSAKAIDEQIAFAAEMLSALGYPENAVRRIKADELSRQLDVCMPAIEPAGFSGIGGKRKTIQLAIDHLYSEAARPKPMAMLTAGAPFGSADVDANACTLCFSCVGACPGKALQTGSEGIPQLIFIEENCLQCGLCTRTCPEDAIWITPRMLFDTEARARKRKLHEEAPFLCTACGKPFATRSVIDSMLNRLKGHYMFQSERSRRRLTLCENCRVVDIVQDEQAMKGGLDEQIRHD
ncbi:MAG: 4Fe-4S binding protein [Chromatiales bacterium]|jgi:ferredoxin